MTVSVKRNKVQYTGDNSTTAFSVTFPYTETSQVKVFLGGTLQTITTHYTLSTPGATGTVTFGTAPGSGVIVSIIRETDYLQAVDYVNNDALDAETLEKAFDKLTMMCQQLDNKIEGAVGFDETVSDSDTTSLKLAAGTTDLAGKLLAFDSTGAFVTTQEIGTFRGSDGTTTTAAYVVRDLIRDSSNDNVYFTKVDAASGSSLTDTNKFELLVDVATVRLLKTQAETAKTASETAKTASEAALASFQGQYKSAATNPYGGAEDEGDLWYDETANILKYYNGTSFEPVTTSLASVTDNYLTISNQVITAGTVPISLGGTGATTASGARTALELGTASTSATGDFEASGAVSTHAALTSSVHGISSFGATLVDDADAATARTTLGLGTAATSATSAFEASGSVSTHAALTSSVHGISSFGATLVDDANAATARTTLGLGTAATTASTDYATAAQGTKADNATQPGDNATTLNVSATDKLLGRSTAGAGSVEEITLTSAGRALLDDADAAAQRSTLGLGTAATTAASAYATSAQGTKADSATQPGDAATTLNVSATNKILGRSSSGAGVVEEISCTSAGRALLDDADAAAQRSTLGLGTIATQASDAVNIDGGAIDAITLGTNSAVTDLRVDNLKLDANTISSTNTNGDITIDPAGTGNVAIGNFTFDADATVGASQDNHVLTYDNSSGLISLEASAGGSTASFIEHDSTVSDSLAIASGKRRLYVGDTSFSGSGAMAGRLVIIGGLANFTSGSALNLTGTLNLVG